MWRKKRKRNYKINPKAERVIDVIASLLTPEELEHFAIVMGEDRLDFKGRMLARYGNWRPMYSLETSRRKAEGIIESHRAVIVPDSRLHTIFLDKFENILFREF